MPPYFRKIRNWICKQLSLKIVCYNCMVWTTRLWFTCSDSCFARHHIPMISLPGTLHEESNSKTGKICSPVSFAVVSRSWGLVVSIIMLILEILAEENSGIWWFLRQMHHFCLRSTSWYWIVGLLFSVVRSCRWHCESSNSQSGLLY